MSNVLLHHEVHSKVNYAIQSTIDEVSLVYFFLRIFPVLNDTHFFVQRVLFELLKNKSNFSSAVFITYIQVICMHDRQVFALIIPLVWNYFVFDIVQQE